jgi:TonB family protein
MHLYTPREIALAAHVAPDEVDVLVARGAIRTIGHGFVPQPDAVRAVRALVRWAEAGGRRPGDLFVRPPATRRATGLPLAVSGTLHAAIAGALVLMTTLGLAEPSASQRITERPEPIRLVYLVQPGPGGGGGGGGRLQLAPPPRARRKAPARPKKKLSVPMPPPRPAPAPVVVAERPVERPTPPPRPPEPAVVAPIASVPADDRDRTGVMADTRATADSAGPGAGGGAGSGHGTGIGEGDGPGLGPGSGGGTGGGPYRPGSGIEPPQLLREVKPDYTEDARRRGVEGNVVLEIVVRRDGSVGDVRILERLGAGLDERAVAAVRQWRFSPARRRGAPVDVVVEVAVEFKLR